MGANLTFVLHNKSLTYFQPLTRRILAGPEAADTPEHGVVDGEHRVFGYQNLLVCDGAVIPANPGVNPSLTITAMPRPPHQTRGPAHRRDGTAIMLQLWAIQRMTQR
jgi:hypothetical protein